MAMQTRINMRWAIISIVALVAVLLAQVQSSSPLTDEANSLRLAELENDLSSPTTLVEMNSQQLQSMNVAAVISEHVQSEQQTEAHSMNEEKWKGMSEEQQRAEVDASLAEVEAAESQQRPVSAQASSLLQTSSKAMSSAQYWNNAWHRRWWCNAVRWGYHWIERHPHWQNICRTIEKFRPWGWWSYMCHNMYSGSWGWWYRHNWWWRRQCESIRNPHYVSNSKAWKWHPQHRRHHYSSWCETYGHQFRDLNNGHYNHYCHGREAPSNYVRGLWDVDPKASSAQQEDYWWCRNYRNHDNNWKSNNGWQAFQNRCAQNEGARGAKYPGYDPNLTPEQRAAIIAKAKAAAEAARLRALRPKWVWAKEVPRTATSKWCEENGLDQSESQKYKTHCEGNRESEADRLKRVAEAARRARKRILATIPRQRATPKPVKQIPVTPYNGSPLSLKAKADEAAAKAAAKLTPEQKAAAAAKAARLAAQAKNNLPAGVKGGNMAGLMKALNIAAKIPAPKSKTKLKPMPAPPSLPPKPKTAPKLTELKKIAKAVVAAKAAPKAAAPAPAPKVAEPAPAAEPVKLEAPKRSSPPPPPPPAPAAPRPQVAAPVVAAAPAQPSLEEQWAKEDARRRAERRARLAEEDKDDRRADRRRALRRAKRLEELKAAKAGKYTGSKGENKDWNAKFPNPVYDPKPRAPVNNLAPIGAPGCPGCKNNGIKKKWEIVLDPTSVAEIDRPLIEELHRRVNYLVEPVAKKLKTAEYILKDAAKQVVDAEEHHIRVYDFELKHKDQLLIPQYIQDEQNEVQL